MEKYPFPISRTVCPESKNSVKIILYYGSVHYSSPIDVVNEVGQQVIYVEDNFKFKGKLTNGMVNYFSRKLFTKLERKVINFWSKYPKAHVELYGTNPRMIISDDGVGTWYRSDYIKINEIKPQDTANFYW